MTSNGIAVSCRGIAKSYGAGELQTQALRGVDLEVRYGELLMLVGPSGSGKSTLLSIVTGILPQDDGECLVLGRDLRRLGVAERARFRGSFIGFVFQFLNLIPSLTAADNVALPLLIGGMERKGALARARQLLGAVGLSGRDAALPPQLSGGQQQRVAIARALVHEPRLIVCDEPTSNLDHDAGQQVLRLLREQAKRPDRALVVVTHDSRIFPFADRIARIEDGRIAEVVPGAGGESAP